MHSPLRVTPFSIHVEAEILSDLRERIRATRWPDPAPNRQFRVALGPDEFVHVPTSVAVFAHSFVDEGTPVREWVERLYEVRRWTPMPRGGHFAPAEEPEMLARDIAAFFAGL